MNNQKLISIDDDQLESVSGGFGLLSCLIIKPVAIVASLLNGLLGACQPPKHDCAPKYNDCAPRPRNRC